MALQQLLSFHAFHASDVMRDLYRGAAQLFNLLILSNFSIRYNFVILVQKNQTLIYKRSPLKSALVTVMKAKKSVKTLWVWEKIVPWINMFPVTFSLVFRADVTQQQECDPRNLKHASSPKKQTPPNIGLSSQTVIPTPKPIHAINQGYNKSDNPAGKRRRASKIILPEFYSKVLAALASARS